MSYLDGQIAFAIIVATILAWLGGMLIARRYSAKILSLMQLGESPKDETTQIQLETTIQHSSSKPEQYSLNKQYRNAKWRYRAVIVLIAIIISLFITFYNLKSAIANEPFSLRRTSLLLLAYAWPSIPCIGLLERWSSLRVIILSLIYTSIVIVLVLLNSGEGSSVLGVMIWLYGQQIPPLVFIWILTGPNIRALGPYLLIVLFLLISASLISYQALDQSLNTNNLNSWVLYLAESTNAYVVFALFGIVPWLFAFFPIKYLAKRVANLYHKKFFSEYLYLLIGIWLIVLLFQALVLSHSFGLSAYTILLGLLFIPTLYFVLQAFLKPRHSPSTLLLLRVFREDDGIGRIFDNVLEYWRYSGNTVMIGGKDLAIRTLEPDELFGFLNGDLQDQFISDKHQLQHRIAELDLVHDPDGRFRINEFFCYDTTWKVALDGLLTKTNLVLMDLRDYHTGRLGCSYELEVLSNNPHLQKIIILFNPKTDREAAEQILDDKADEIIWVKETHKKNTDLEKRILSALLN